ncbi:glutaminase [Endozoicomonas sp.]|uniref:glutaminase n=1 Tax=Endozoicomonas sp. TaxID=1892382 RepID=UPI0028870F82|nr:glutaminase [Endozoicomonas sp.]
MASEKKESSVVSVDGMAGVAEKAASAKDEHQLRQLFTSLQSDSSAKTLALMAIPSSLERYGIFATDPRLREMVEAIRTYELRYRSQPKDITFDEFASIVSPNTVIVDKVLKGEMVIPEFRNFTDRVETIYQQTLKHREGKVASYIPQLASVEPEQFGVSLCTIDGQRFSIGNTNARFCIQSCCKPVNYCLALEEHGADAVHEHVSCEPSGQSFNELALNQKLRPHNPMINAGAIMCCSLLAAQGTGYAGRPVSICASDVVPPLCP